MFQFLARSNLDWARVHLFWVDERAVPPDHPESNFHLVDQWLIQPARIGDHNVHRIHGELAPQEAASRYRDDLLKSGPLTTADLPQFDVIHLGMGPDAHTASLFPGEPLVDDRAGIAAAVYVEKIPQWRITLLPRVLLAARDIALLVTGEDKRSALQRVFADEYSPRQFPAQLIAHNATNATWFLDEAGVESLDRI
jgi:6-phosphogluconolactonase